MQTGPRIHHQLRNAGQLRPDEWGNGYAAEAAGALVRWAFTQDIGELYAVAIPSNTRAIATCGRLGMQWVGESNSQYLWMKIF